MQTNILEYLEDTVKRLPEKPAFVGVNTMLTFRELYEGARSIGSALAEMGHYKEAVLVYMEKSPQTIETFFGVVYSGCFFVPLDAEMPLKRIELIIESTKAGVLICDEKSLEKAKHLNFDGEIILADTLKERQENEKSLQQVRDRAIDTDPVYILFTSGSTGIPKGCIGHHRGVIDYIEQLSAVMNFSEETIFGNQAPLYVDACMKELYPTIKFGATTYLIPKQLFMFPLQLVDYLNEHRINTICWVASALTMVSSFGALDEKEPEYLHTIGFGGEVFPVKQLNLWKKFLPDASFVNLYGPTEITGVCCYYRADRLFGENEVIPVGRAFKNMDVFILKDDMTCAKNGEEGEICVRGTGLTHGYYANSEKTAEVFVQNPLNPYYPETIYKTGDIGRWNKDGELEFVSRKDCQIKHMGHRIELGEIEACVSAVAGVQMTACIYDGKKNKIILFYLGELTEKELILKMKERIPRYMLPNRTIRLEQMPFTSNGKLDRKALKEMYNKEQKDLN